MTTEDKKISELYREANATEPSAHLDDSILAASRRDVKRQSSAKSPFSGSWPVPVAMAAVVIVAVIIVPLVMQETKQDRAIPEKATVDLPAIAPVKAPEKTQASPSRLKKSPPGFIQSTDMEDQLMEERVMLEAPAASAPASLLYEMDSSGSGTTMGRTIKQNKPTEAQLERKATAVQNLKKKERTKDMRTPEEWHVYINELMAAGETRKAAAEIKVFIQLYPDYPIDPQLKELLD